MKTGIAKFQWKINTGTIEIHLNSTARPLFMCEVKNIFQVLIYSQDFEKQEPSFKLFIWGELCPAILDDKLDVKIMLSGIVI